MNRVPRTGASEATERIRQKDPPDWSIRGRVEGDRSPWTGSSGGEPGATDWRVRGNGENTRNRRPGLEHPGRRGARHKPPDWIVRGGTRGHGLEHPRQRRENGKKSLGLEHPGRTGARPKQPDWIVRWCTRCHGQEHPGTQRTRTGTSGDEAAREWNVRGNEQGEADGGGETRRGQQEQEQGTEGGGQEGEKTRSGRRKRRR